MQKGIFLHSVQRDLHRMLEISICKKIKIEAINQATEAREYYSERKVGKPLQKEGKNIA